MGYRVFRDSAGTEWQTWDVVPQLAERRKSERRREHAAATPRSDRRHEMDRRILVGRRPVLGAGLDGGWLCFEAQVEKRRLTPIPQDWLRCPEQKLEQYCRAARPAARSTAPVELSTLLDRPA